MIDRELFFSLKPPARSLYQTFAFLVNQQGYIKIGMKALREEAGFGSSHTLIRHIEALEAAKILRVTRARHGAKNAINEYQFTGKALAVVQKMHHESNILAFPAGSGIQQAAVGDDSVVQKMQYDTPDVVQKMQQNPQNSGGVVQKVQRVVSSSSFTNLSTDEKLTSSDSGDGAAKSALKGRLLSAGVYYGALKEALNYPVEAIEQALAYCADNDLSGGMVMTCLRDPSHMTAKPEQSSTDSFKDLIDTGLDIPEQASPETPEDNAPGGPETGSSSDAENTAPENVPVELINGQLTDVLWQGAYNQMALQLDRTTFDTCLKDARYMGYENGRFTVGVYSDYARDMLAGRLYRTVRAILRWNSIESAEIYFVVQGG
ncbi:MAG: hypothetical protein ACPG7F_00645 [Aggregatilineales bacterium]